MSLFKITMSATVEIIIVLKFVKIFLDHTSVCATLAINCTRMVTPAQVRKSNLHHCDQLYSLAPM